MGEAGVTKFQTATSPIALMATGQIPRQVLGYATVLIEQQNGEKVRERLPLYLDGSSATSSADGVVVIIENLEIC